MKCIVVAADGSADAGRAIDTAAHLAKALGAELVILTVGGSISGAELRQLADTGGKLSETLELASQEILRQAEKRAQKSGIPAPRLRHEWGDPAEVIIDVVQKEKADMVVAGRRGHGRLAGLLMGSVSQKLAALAPCAVVIVP